MSMRAIRISSFGGPEVLKCVLDVPLPKPGQKQVIVAVKAAGLNPVDTYIRSGTYARKPVLPYTPSLDGAGVIHSIGDGVTSVKPGDRVWFWASISGSCAEYSLCGDDRVYPLSDDLTFEQGAAIGTPYLTADRALFHKCQVKAGDNVLIHGASGGVGVAACQLALSVGAIVHATAGTDEGIAMLTNLGVKHIYNHRKPTYLDELKNANEGNGFSCILEMLANVNLQNDLDLAAKAGRIVVIGSRGEITVNPRSFMAKECSVCGVLLFHSSEEEFRMSAMRMQEMMAKRTLLPVIARTYPLADTAQAHIDIMSSTGAKGKLVVCLV